jgi:hypothetical protein
MSPAFHTPFESLMRSADKKGSEMEEMVRMNNNHQAQHVRHTHRHTEEGGNRECCWTYLLFLCVQGQTARLNRKKREKKQRCHYRSFKCFYVSASPDKHFNLLLVQLFPLLVPIFLFQLFTRYVLGALDVHDCLPHELVKTIPSNRLSRVATLLSLLSHENFSSEEWLYRFHSQSDFGRRRHKGPFNTDYVIIHSICTKFEHKKIELPWETKAEHWRKRNISFWTKYLFSITGNANITYPYYVLCNTDLKKNSFKYVDYIYQLDI